MNNKQKRGILSIVGLGLSVIGTVIGYAGSKLDDEIQTEKINLAVDNKINQLDLSPYFGGDGTHVQ